MGSRSKTMLAYRRRAHVVVWDKRRIVTTPGWDLYWVPTLHSTVACVEEQEDVRYWLPVLDLYDHWHFLTGCIDGVRIYPGLVDRPGPQVVLLTHCDRRDEDTGKQYFRSFRHLAFWRYY